MSLGGDATAPLVKHAGGCHCRAVRYQVMAPAKVQAWDCNCTICSMKGAKHFVVPKERFELVQGQDSLTLYQFNKRVAKHYFCKVCGISSFYVPRSDPDGYGIAVNCMDPGTLEDVQLHPCDGQNWEEYMANRNKGLNQT